MKIRRVATELGHVRGHMRGEEIDDAEHTALHSPFVPFVLTLLVSEDRERVLHTSTWTHIRMHTHMHTRVHPGAGERIPCPP